MLLTEQSLLNWIGKFKDKQRFLLCQRVPGLPCCGPCESSNMLISIIVNDDFSFVSKQAYIADITLSWGYPCHKLTPEIEMFLRG